MAIVTISSKGQIVIPAFIRKTLGINPNSKILLTLSEDKTKALLEPLSDNPIETLTGIFKDHPVSLAEQLLKERKTDRGKEEA
jgi:AbrB family looped-hinge helix DNA binding protein